MGLLNGNSLALSNECGLGCIYCGYTAAKIKPLDLEQLKVEARSLKQAWEAELARGGVRDRAQWIGIVGKDPLEHPQIRDIVDVLLSETEEITLQTTGVRLHAERDHWASYDRIIWELPFTSADPETHNHIVGRPGHFDLMADLIADQRFRITLNVLLIDAVLEKGGLTAIAEYLRPHERNVILRYPTPRDPGSDAHYTQNVLPHREAWTHIEAALNEGELTRFLDDNVECFPPCVVPDAWQVRHLTRYAADVHPHSARAWVDGMWDLGPCPHEAECPVGDACLGVHRMYAKSYGYDAFGGEHFGEEATTALRTMNLDATRELKRLLRGALEVKGHLAESRYVECARAFHQLAKRTPAQVNYWRYWLDDLKDQVERGLHGASEEAAESGDLEKSQAVVEALREAGLGDSAENMDRRVGFMAAEKARDQKDWDGVLAALEAMAAESAAYREDGHWQHLANHARIQQLYGEFSARKTDADYAGAAKILEEVLALDPNDPDAQRELDALAGYRAAGEDEAPPAG